MQPNAILLSLLALATSVAAVAVPDTPPYPDSPPDFTKDLDLQKRSCFDDCYEEWCTVICAGPTPGACGNAGW